MADYKLDQTGEQIQNDLDKIEDITVSATELNYCDGVQSNIQDQLDAKAGFAPTVTILSSQVTSMSPITILLTDAQLTTIEGCVNKTNVIFDLTALSLGTPSFTVGTTSDSNKRMLQSSSCSFNSSTGVVSTLLTNVIIVNKTTKVAVYSEVTNVSLPSDAEGGSVPTADGEGDYSWEVVNGVSYSEIFTATVTAVHITASGLNPTTVTGGSTAVFNFTADGTVYKTPAAITDLVGATSSTFTRTSDTVCSVSLVGITGNASFTITGVAI